MSLCDFSLAEPRPRIPMRGRAGTKPLTSRDGPRKSSGDPSWAELPGFLGLQPLMPTAAATEPAPAPRVDPQPQLKLHLDSWLGGQHHPQLVSHQCVPLPCTPDPTASPLVHQPGPILGLQKDTIRVQSWFASLTSDDHNDN